MPLHVLRRKQLLPVPIDQAFPFFADAANLEIITPPWLNFRILTQPPIAMRPGTLIDYKLSWHGAPIRWRTEIRKWNPPFGFVDTQIRGPYQLWHHTHKFVSVEGGAKTLMTDTVWYKLPLGPLGVIAYRLKVKRDVERIFDYLYGAISKLIGS